MRFWKNIKQEVKNFPAIKVSKSFWAVLLFAFLADSGKIYTEGIFFAALHELCHIAAAAAFGLKAPGICVTPIGLRADIEGFYGICCAKRCIVLAAGPLFNLVAGILMFSIGRSTEMYINAALFICNLLPALPLDGGRLIKEIFGECFGILNAQRICYFVTKSIGIAIIVSGMIIMIFYCMNVSIVCLGIYIAKENKRAYISDIYEFYRIISSKRDACGIMRIREIALCEGADITKALRRISFDKLLIVDILKDGKISGRLTQWELIEEIKNNLH